MNHKLKIVVIFLVDAIVSYMSSPYFGRLYEKIIGYRIPGGWIGSCPECYEGFVISFAFLSGLLFFGILDKNRINITLPFVLVPAFLLLFARQGDAFLIALGFAVVGLGVGQALYWLRKKIKTAKTVENKEGK
jgi:hypothetical protein